MTSNATARTRLTWLTALLFVGAVLGGSAAFSRHERVLQAALPLSLALFCGAGAWWLHGASVRHRRTFTWLGREYAGPSALRFAAGMRAGGVGFALLGLWVFALWWLE